MSKELFEVFLEMLEEAFMMLNKEDEDEERKTIHNRNNYN